MRRLSGDHSTTDRLVSVRSFPHRRFPSTDPTMTAASAYAMQILVPSADHLQRRGQCVRGASKLASKGIEGGVSGVSAGCHEEGESERERDGTEGSLEREGERNVCRKNGKAGVTVKTWHFCESAFVILFEYDFLSIYIYALRTSREFAKGNVANYSSVSGARLMSRTVDLLRLLIISSNQLPSWCIHTIIMPDSSDDVSFWYLSFHRTTRTPS